MIQYTGLVTPNGDLVDLKKKLQLFEHNWRVQYGNLSDGLKTVVETLSVDPPQWKATISLPGHYGFHMSGCGASRKLALRHAYMNAIVKITVCFSFIINIALEILLLFLFNFYLKFFSYNLYNKH